MYPCSSSLQIGPFSCSLPRSLVILSGNPHMESSWRIILYSRLTFVSMSVEPRTRGHSACVLHLLSRQAKQRCRCSCTSSRSSMLIVPCSSLFSFVPKRHVAGMLNPDWSCQSRTCVDLLIRGPQKMLSIGGNCFQLGEDKLYRSVALVAPGVAVQVVPLVLHDVAVRFLVRFLLR